MSQPLILIQARNGGSRLPGKVNMLIGDRRMLDIVTARVRLTGLKWMLCRAEDYREVAEEDVLGRFQAALESIDADGDAYDPIIRITADCPALDIGLVHRALTQYSEQYPAAHLVGTSPAWDGLDVEVLSRYALAQAHHAAVEPSEREHPTLWLRRNVKWYEIALDGPPLRWSVDTRDHLDFIREVFRTCEHCRDGQPHRMRESRAGLRPIWDIHDVYGIHPSGAPEPLCCEAFDLLEAHTGGPVYRSA